MVAAAAATSSMGSNVPPGPWPVSYTHLDVYKRQTVASTIGLPAGPGRKFHWTRRLRAYAYRLGNEWQRLLYGLRHAWLERRA